MTPVRWSPLVGGTVISRRAWERIPQEFRTPMLAAAQQAGERLRPTIRKMGDDAVSAMQKRGLNVVDLNDDELRQWQSEAEAAYPRIRGSYVDAELFDEVRALRDEFRRSSNGVAQK
jgi:TRAP-type C4-dicarboxylate transport system substrate-binding protein